MPAAKPIDARPRGAAGRPTAYLFDLDGVLVRTEELHFAAYREVAAATGRDLPWSFERYCLAAHYGTERLRGELAAALPGLLPDVAAWDALYAAKSRAYLELLARAPIELLPGAAAALERLTAAGTACAVVTNSTREQTARVRRRQPVLDSVPVWVTREDYAAAKPAPDGYRVALARLGVAPAAALGFEDTPRGVQALVAAGVDAVLVTHIPYPDLGVEPRLVVPSLAALPEELLPAAPA
jgi:HAD superfamily hydrolase (TIGR01509 family)